MTADGLCPASSACVCADPSHEPRLVVLTGGPGAGKTAVLELVKQVLCRHIEVLPEAAGVVYGGGFWRRPSLVARKAAQRAIFHVQRELETIALEERQAAVALCDRATLDGLAYWPGDESEFWRETGITREHEYRKYAAVIHLRTPALAQGYNHQNPLRIESAQEAKRIDERILAAWEGHPRRLFVESSDDFVTKARRAIDLIRAELPPCCRGHFSVR